MQTAAYYRHQAERVRTVRQSIDQEDVLLVPDCLAVDYDDIATDLETGAIEIRHAEMMPQLKHQRSNS